MTQDRPSVGCPTCSAENDPDARFCRECGERLAGACPTCDSPVDVGQRFCSVCGTALQTAAARTPAAPVAERRMCSVLFCDLVGFTPIAESRDPETVRELLSRYFDETRVVIERYGGIVEKFIGDAVMAIWGAPVATEEDAERAVRAALDLIDAVHALGESARVPGLAARVGIVTGQVAVTIGAVGQGMVAGDPVNTAARLQAAAAPGEVFVDDTTARLVRSSIALDDLGALRLKGKSGPEQAWRPTRVLGGIGGIQRVDGLEGPLIGRDFEVRMLKDMYHATVERRAPRLVLISGAPGAGKSRLGWEFEKYIDGLTAPVLWHRSRCLSYGDGIAFWALAEMMRQRFGIAEAEPIEVALPLLLEGLERHVPDPAERSFVGVRLGRLLGLQHPDDDDRYLERSELFAGWRTWLIRLADDAPVVWVIEDLHHADSGLLEFIDHLLGWSRTYPIHILGLARPEIEEFHPGWLGGRHHQQIALEPLDDGAVHEMLQSVVPGMPPEAMRLVATQANGNPLFVIETIRALIDEDVVQPVDGRYHLVGRLDDLSVPTSLRSMLVARLDSLPQPLRDLLATAAVLGNSFTADALAAVAQQPTPDVENDLGTLVARDLLSVSADPLSPNRGSYAFSNELLRRVSMETLSRYDRRERHLRVAAHLRSSFSDDGEEVAEVVAHHLLDAADAVPDAEDAADRVADAVELLVRSAERALRLGAPRRATRSFEEASVRATDASAAAGLLERAASSALDAGDQAKVLTIAERAAGAYMALGDERRASSVEALGAVSLLDVGQVTTARERLARAVAVLRVDPDELTMRALRSYAWTSLLGGFDDGRMVVEETLRLGESLDVTAAELSRNFALLAALHSFNGERHRALAAQREAIRLATSAGTWMSVVNGFNNMAADEVDWDPAAAVESARSTLRFARQTGFRVPLALGLENLQQALDSLGRWDETTAALDRARLDDDIADLAAFHVANGRAAALRGDQPLLDEMRRGLADLHAEDLESRAYLGLLDLYGELGTGNDDSVLERALHVVGMQDELGINFSAVRDAWVIGARTAHRTRPTAEHSLVEALSARRPTELCPMLRAELLLARARLSDQPETAFPAALQAQRSASPPHLLAHGLLDFAESRTAAGDADRAHSLVDEAEQIADRLGAAPVSARARAVRSVLVQQFRANASPLQRPSSRSR